MPGKWKGHGKHGQEGEYHVVRVTHLAQSRWESLGVAGSRWESLGVVGSRESRWESLVVVGSKL
jgi:hypothetical protein